MNLESKYRPLVYVDTVTHRKVKVFYAISIEDLLKVIDPDQYLYVDMETYNDSKFYKGGFYGKVRIVTLKQDHWNFVIALDMDFSSAQDFNKLNSLLRGDARGEPYAYVVGYNFAYDFSTLQEHMLYMPSNSQKGELADMQQFLWQTVLGTDAPVHELNDRKEFTPLTLSKYTDLLILTRELNPLQKADSLQGRFSLDDSYLSLLGFDPYEQFGIDKKKMQKAKWGGTVSQEMILYAALDVEYLPALHARLMEIERQTYENASDVAYQAYKTRLYNAHLAVSVGLKMQDVGLCVDVVEADKYIKKYREEAKTALGMLQASGIPKEFNPTSPKQVKEITRLPKSDKVTLKFAQHRDGNKIVSYIMQYRKGNSRSSTVTKWLQLTNEYGRVYGHYQPTTTTGRFSSSQENMQNQPRDSKTVFKAPDNAVLIGFDYAQIELRTMCAITGDERMYDVFRSFGDIHKNTQDMCRLKERVVAKQVNFGNLYGMGAAKFQELLIKDDIYMEEEVIKNIQKDFYGVYKRIKEYHNFGASNSKRGIPNRSILGHPYYSKFFNQMNNLANQASGTSEVAKMFFRYADEIGLIHSNTCELSVQIHDSNLFNYYGKLEYVDHYAYAIGLLAQKAWFTCLDWGVKLGTSKYADIPMPVEVGTSTHWKSVDDNIVQNLTGLEYYNDKEGMDNWLKQFKDNIHDINIRREFI